MKATAIFGGAFDPPHVGHLNIICALLNSELASEVWLVPTGDNRDKPANAPSIHRSKMLQLLLEENFQKDPTVRLDLSQAQDKFPGSHTVDLMAHLRTTHRDRDFVFVIGSDLLPNLSKWKEPERLKKEVQFVVMPRNGFALTAGKGFNFSVVPEEHFMFSGAASSTIRRLVRENKKTAGLLTPAVLSYINSNKLYR